MDINLGDGMDGTEAALEILRTHAIPVLFLSGHTEQEIVERTEKITSYGYTAEEAIGHKLWELIIPPEMVSDVKQAVHHMASTETPNSPETLFLMHKDGSRVRVRSSHSVTRNAPGNVELFCLDIPLDISLDQSPQSCASL